MTDQDRDGAGRVLVAEDVEVISFKLTATLKGAGYEVDSATDGEQCLEKVDSFKPDLILLDLMMPKLHGIEVLRRLRANPETRHIGVIVCSAKGFKTEHTSATDLGTWDFLVKPIGRDHLLERVGGTGSCKRGLIAVYREQIPNAYCVHIGNGRVSDLCGALEADLAFAKDTLVPALDELGHPYIRFDTLHDVLAVLSKRPEPVDPVAVTR